MTQEYYTENYSSILKLCIKHYVIIHLFLIIQTILADESNMFKIQP